MSEQTPIEPVLPAADAVKAEGYWATKIAGRVNAHGASEAAKRSLGEMKDSITFKAPEGAKLKGFARIGSIGVGAYVASGALQSKNSDGTDRGALHRLGNLVVGGGMVAGGMLAGGR